MIIDSPITSGSYAGSGPFRQIGDVQITGSLSVTGTIRGSITGSVTSASYATNAELLDNLDSSAFVFTSSFNTYSGSVSTRISTIEGSYATTGSNRFNGNQSITGSVSITGSLTQNGNPVILQNGNSVGTQLLLGTNDNQNLALETNGSVRMFVSSSGNVGIGTTSPGVRLEISGDAAISNGNYLSLSSNNPTFTRIYRSGGLIFENNTYQMVFTDAGNVGIGTTSPSYLLTVGQAGTTTDSYIQIASSTTGTGNLFFGDATGGGVASFSGYIQYQHSVDAMVFGTSSTERMRITSAGRILMGTTTDNGSRLQVNGNATISSRLAIGTSDQSYASFFIGGDLTTGGSQYALLLDPQLSGTNNSVALYTNARIKANTAVTNAYGLFVLSAERLSGATITNNYGVYIQNQVSGTSLNYSIYSEGGLNYFGGNVGIGTTSPSTDLQISRAGSSTIRLTNTNNSTNVELGIATALGFVGTQSDNSFAINTNNTERMRITAAGRILMGTTTDNGVDRLQVSGSAIFSSSVGGNLFYAGSTFMQAGRFYVYGTGTSGAGAKIQITSANYGFCIEKTTDDLFFGISQGNGGGPWIQTYNWDLSSDFYGNLRVRGDVGIGTTSPSNLLHVAGTGRFSYTGTGSGTFINFANGNGVIGSITGSGLETFYNTSSDYRLKEDLKEFDGLKLIDSLKVYNYAWKSTSARSHGVLAHELQSVLPYAVTGEKDGEQMQGVDYSKLVPILAKAIQELKAELDLLKSK